MYKYKTLFIIVSLTFFISCKAYFIPTGAMQDTLHIGDHLFAKFVINYKPTRGDLIIFPPPQEKDKDYIKRVIAIPGDHFNIKDNTIFINNKKIYENYAKGITQKSSFSVETYTDIYDKIVPNDKIIVLGDNRENSMDSRHLGYVIINSIKAKPFLLYWNTAEVLNGDFSRFGFIK